MDCFTPRFGGDIDCGSETTCTNVMRAGCGGSGQKRRCGDRREAAAFGAQASAGRTQRAAGSSHDGAATRRDDAAWAGWAPR